MSEQLEIVAPDRRKHRQAIFDLTAKCFPHAGYWNWLDRADAYFDDCIYDWGAARIGLLDGQVVTHFGVWDHQIRVGGGRLRVAGIGAVATHGKYRKRGLLLKTGAACIAGLGEAGYDLTALHGIPKFYHKLGYVHGWPGENWTIEAGELPAAGKSPRLQRFALKHREDLARLYSRQNATLTGTAVRPTFLRCRNEWEGYLWKDAGGRPVGYVVVGQGQEKLHLIDFAGEPAAVLDALRRIALRKRLATVEMVWLHYDSSLARAMRRLDCRLEAHYKDSGGAMIRTASLRSSLGKLAEELGRRLSRSHMAQWRGELLIADPRERVMLEITRSKVAVTEATRGRAANAIRGGEEIARLLIGAGSAGEVAETYGTKTTGLGRELMTAMFPDQHPALSPWDFY